MYFYIGMEIKDIQGNILIDALVTEQAVKVDELMKQHSITLSWVSVTDEELPLGAYIEHEGVKYSLLAPYNPEQSDEATYAYKPVFEHPIMRWQYIPFFFYTYSEGKVVSKELDWNLTDNPANFMKAVCDAILNETGEDWSYEISADLSASASQSFSNTDIFSALNAIAGAFETEWWFDYANKIVYLSKASFGSAVTLEVGQNIGVPSKNQSKDGYYTRFYAFGSTRNIEQNYAGSNVNSIVNKRLTLNPAKYPNGYIDIREGLTESEILVKTLVFDDIYPSSSLAIADVKVRLMWRLDSDKKKVQIGTDSNGNPVYDQYAIWYFKVPGLQFDKDSIISGKPLSVHFNSGALNGREFELTYLDTEEDVETSDGTSVHVEKGDFKINFIEEGTFIIPAISGLVPNDGDDITLFNIKMPEEYKTSAYNDLEEAVLKEIAKQDVDNNNYTFESNKEAFYESNPNLTVGRKVLYKNGNSVLETRVIKLETQLDYAFEQKITIGNEQIKGNTQTLKEEVVNANQNIDLISAINESTQQLVQSYQRTQKALLDSMAKWGDMWSYDKELNAVKTTLNIITEGTISMAGEDKGEGGDTPVGSNTLDGLQDVDVTAPTEGDVLTYDKNNGKWVNKPSQAGLDTKELEDFLTNEGYAKSADVENTYATKAALQTLQKEHNTLNTKVTDLDDLLNSDTSGVIDTWNEVVDFIDEYSGSEDLATILSGMNNDIKGKASQEEVDRLKDEVEDIDERFTDGKANEAKKVENKLSFGTKEYDGSKAENIEASDLDAVTTKGNQTITGEKTFTAPINANGGIDIENGKSLKIGSITLSYDEQSDSLKIDGNVWSEGTMSMNGYDEEGESGETTATDLNGLTDVRITSPSAGDVLTYDDVNNEWVNKPADKGLNKDELQEFLDDNDYAKKDDIPSTKGLATEDWVESQGYLTSVPSKYVTDTELADKGYTTKTEVDNKLQAGLSGAFTSLQSNTRTPVSMTIGGVTKVIDQEALRKSLALGTAAYKDETHFATKEEFDSTDTEVDEHTKVINTLQQTLTQATATIMELQRRLAIVEDWGFQFDMTEGGSRILVTPHNFVSEGAISFSGESANEEFEQKIVLITQAEYDALAAKGQINETKIYYVY